MPKKPLVFLLDAGPVIRLHQLGLWDSVVERAELVLPEIIARNEAQYWTAEDGRRHIDLSSQERQKSIRIIDVDATELAATQAIFDASIRDSVHDGEMEALTVIRSWEGPLPRFCTADRLATIALCLLGFAETAVSLEKLLEHVGLGRTIGPKWYRESAMQEWLKEGRARRITRQGLAGQDSQFA
jgi:hypothetical protein